MNRYGQSITVGTASAPQVFTGVCTRFDYGPQQQETLDPGMDGEHRALILHGKKRPFDFEAKITQESTNFLDLAAGAKIAVTGMSGGTILAARAWERWTLGQAKVAGVSGAHYYFTGGSGGSAGTDLDAFTPDQAALGILIPSGQLIHGTFGLTHAAGVVHGLTVTQEWTLSDDDEAPDGSIPGCTAHGYLRRIELQLLATAALPTESDALVITGAPDHATDFRNVSCRQTYSPVPGKLMYSVNATWIPPFSA